MKKLTLILLVLLMAITVVSCKKEKTDAPAGMKEVSNGAEDFQLFVPEKWEVDRADRGMIMVHVPETDGDDVDAGMSNLSLTCQDYPFDNDKYKTAEDYYVKYVDGEYKAQIQGNFHDAEFESVEKCEIDGKEGRSLVFTATVGENVYKYKQVFVVGPNATIYIFTYTSSVERFDNHIKNLDKIIAEFRFL